MISSEEIAAQLPNVLNETNFGWLGEPYIGKVRDCYTRGDVRYLITTDRLSCFDVVVTTVPFKGQTLTELAMYWFEQSRDLVPNHVIDHPHPNVVVARQCEMLPVEVVVRGYLAGSAGRDYRAGKLISGIRLPPGMKESERLPEPIITPSTKAAKGAHDQPISEQDILQTGLVERGLWSKVSRIALDLFDLGTRKAAERGLILVDTKYEFGLYRGELVLADEIHTMDSSRYWVASTYPDRLKRGEKPEMLDKEPTRQWLLSQGYQGSGPIPEFTDEHRIEISSHYIDAYERITGKSFSRGSTVSLEQALRDYLRR